MHFVYPFIEVEICIAAVESLKIVRPQAPLNKKSVMKKRLILRFQEYSTSSLNWLRKAEFLMSAPKLNLCVEDTGYEVAFAGRSNAGKSSAINALTNQKQLARASKKTWPYAND